MSIKLSGLMSRWVMPFSWAAFQALGCLDGDGESLGQLEGAFLDPRAQRTAFQEGHDDKRPSLGLVDFVNRADIRMIQPRGGFCLALETLAGLFVSQQVRREEFQGDGAVELGVLGLVDDTHAALAELGGDFVVRNGLADHRSVGFSLGDGAFVRL